MNHIKHIIIHLFTFKIIVSVSLIYYVYIKITYNFINKQYMFINSCFVIYGIAIFFTVCIFLF